MSYLVASGYHIDCHNVYITVVVGGFPGSMWIQLASRNFLKTFITTASPLNLNIDEIMNLEHPQLLFSPHTSILYYSGQDFNVHGKDTFEFKLCLPPDRYTIVGGNIMGTRWNSEKVQASNSS